jgi:hypothetical protein
MLLNPGFRRQGMGMNQAPGMRIMDNIPNLQKGATYHQT